MDLKGAGPNIAGVSERNTGETRPRALSQSAMHSFERGDRGNTQALAELAQVISLAWNYSVIVFSIPKVQNITIMLLSNNAWCLPFI